jgi:hypothetical protein
MSSINFRVAFQAFLDCSRLAFLGSWSEDREAFPAMVLVAFLGSWSEGREAFPAMVLVAFPGSLAEDREAFMDSCFPFLDWVPEAFLVVGQHVRVRHCLLRTPLVVKIQL